MDDVPFVADYLWDWLSRQELRLQPTTLKGYESSIRAHLEPNLPGERLEELTGRKVTKLYVRLLERGGQGGRPLAPGTVQGAHTVLRGALKSAVAEGLIEDNPCDRAILPKRRADGEDVTKGAVRAWTPEQVRTFVDFAADDPLRDLWIVAIGTGMRRGELLGLGWGDVEWDRQVIHVRRALSVVSGQVHLKSTKTLRPRSLYYDDVVAGALDRLATRRPMFPRSGRGERWDLVVTNGLGRYLHPGFATAGFRRVVLEAPVPTIPLHGLRHTHASLMLAAGVPVQVVSERLGHRRIQTTLKVYAHMLPAMDRDAVAAFAAHVFGGEPER